MGFQKQYFDLVLVSGSLLIMFAYNLFHLYMYHNHPKTTVLGFENQKKKVWVENIMKASITLFFHLSLLIIYD